jgi:hypothetical protein
MTKRLLFFGVVIVSLVFGQGTDAVVSGTVADSSGAVISGATVVVTNLRTGIQISTTSNEAGIYLYPSLQPGVYRLAGEHPGFKRYVLNEVTLNTADKVSINLTLDVGNVNESVEVRAENETTLGYATASVGRAITGQDVQQLPLTNRDALSLVNTQAGVQGANISGVQRVGLNISMDGINIQDSRTNFGLTTPLFTSVDRVGEVQVINSPADAELGRGIGHVVILSRSGTNEFHGSLFEQLRNTALNANSFFNNLSGLPRNILIRNQFGGSIDGPIRKNKTFFRFHVEAQRLSQQTTITQTVYTASARQGLFRYFPGAPNANAAAAQATVDPRGNPLRPAAATGDLQTVSLFNRDASRPLADPTGTVQKALALTPLPNDFRSGDGLNTAGYTWQRPQPFPRTQFDFKIDHYFTPTERFAVTYTRENNDNPNANQPQPFPTVPGGTVTSWIRVLSVNVLSSLKPNLINEFRGGFHRPKQAFLAPWDLAGSGFLPQLGSQPYLLGFSQITSPFTASNSPTGVIGPYARTTSTYQYADTISWLKGKHAFKAGGEIFFLSSNGFNAFNVTPRINQGNGALGAPLNITNIAGIGSNGSLAQGMLNDLAGSIDSMNQAFNIDDPFHPKYAPGLDKQRTWTSREFSGFAKDDYKVSRNLTLNLGVRYEFYSPIYDATGRTASLVGGSGRIFGISGTNFGAMFQPGLNQGSLTQVQLVAHKSPNPDIPLYQPDKNNFAPAIGLAWNLPQARWLGNRTVVLRIGYGWSYERITPRHIDDASGNQPGVRLEEIFRSSNALNLTNVVLPLTPSSSPLATFPVTDRTQIGHAMDTNMRNAYIENWNVGLQAGLTAGTTLRVSYVGSKGTRLMLGTDINETNIFENGISDAFRATQAGGNSSLMNRLFQGLNVPGVGVVDGLSITGSDAVRRNTTLNAFLAANDVGGFANFLNTNNFLTGQIGGIPRRAGLPENWITVNPQFVAANYTSNFGSSVYHSMQVELSKRLSNGFIFSANYTLAKAFGEEEGNSTAEQLNNYRTLRNRSLDRRLLSFSIKQALKGYGNWELPFGPNRRFLRSRGWRARLVEHWETGFVFTAQTGTPLGFGVNGNTFNNFGGATAVALAAIPSGIGTVTRLGNGVNYFSGYSVVNDPAVQAFASEFRGRSTMRAIADPAGHIILVNPAVGTLGSLGTRPIYGPGLFDLDLNLIKTITVKERWTLQLRADATAITNTPQFGNPTLSINSLNFGNITSAGGNRVVTVEARIRF